jgi:TatD DNase family protein
MIDTHAHLNPSGSISLNPSLTRGTLYYVILAGANLEDSKENIKAAKKNNKLLPAVGIHPQEKIYDLGFMIYELEKLLKDNPKIVAVGECGLEFVKDCRDAPVARLYKTQEILFRAQISLALKYKKTLIVHSREAAEETLAIL